MGARTVYNKKLYMHIGLIIAAVIAVLGFVYEVMAIL